MREKKKVTKKKREKKEKKIHTKPLFPFYSSPKQPDL